MIGDDQIIEIVEVVGVDPGTTFRAVANPINEVLEFATIDAGVEDFGNLVFLFAGIVHDWSGWRIRIAGRKGIGSIRFQERNMEDGMDLHAFWKLEAIGCSTDFGEDLVGTEEEVFEFLAWSSSRDMEAAKADLVAGREVGIRRSLSIGVSLVDFLGG